MQSDSVKAGSVTEYDPTQGIPIIVAPPPNPLRVWNRFSQTDKKATKAFDKGGFKGTDINPTYRLKCLTELFGPQGTGWGWTIHERWREKLPSRYKDGQKWVDYEADCAFVMLSLWYVGDDGLKHEGSPQIGGTECDLSPDEVWKMSITDAVGKCCVALGIAADVYLGEFDGKYQRERPSPPPQRAASTDADGHAKAYFAATKAKGMTLEETKALMWDVTGAEKSGDIPAEKWPALMEAVQKWERQ